LRPYHTIYVTQFKYLESILMSIVKNNREIEDTALIFMWVIETGELRVIYVIKNTAQAKGKILLHDQRCCTMR